MSNKDDDIFENEFDTELDNQIPSADEQDTVLVEDDNGFEDDLSFDDEDAFLEDDNDDDAFNDVKTTSSSGMNWFNIGIIAFVVIGIVGVTYIYMPGLFGGGSTQIPAQQTAQVQQPVEQVQETNEPMGLLQNPELILNDDDMRAIENQIANQDNSGIFEALNQPAPVNTDGLFDALRGQNNASNNDGDLLNPMPSAPDMAGTEFDTLPLPADSNIIDLETNFDEQPPFDIFADIAQDEPIIEQPMVNLAPANPVAMAPAPEIESLNNRLDGLETSIETIMNRLDNLATAMQNAPAPVVQTDNGDIQTLRDTIATLDNKITSLNTQLQETKAQPEPELIPLPQAEAPAPKKAETPKVTSTPKARPAAPRVQYDLRGVSNGIAYLSRKGTDNLQTVAVGNTVQGLGRITSIEQNNGRWVVRGTSGSVRQ